MTKILESLAMDGTSIAQMRSVACRANLLVIIQLPAVRKEKPGNWRFPISTANRLALSVIS